MVASEMNNTRVSEIILQFLEERKLSEEQIVEGFLSAICVEKRYEKLISQCIISMSLPLVSSHYMKAT